MSHFLDISNLTKEDFEEIRHIASALSISFNKAMWKYMNKNPGKIKVLGEVKNGKIIRDEIDENGVKEYTGEDALKRIIKEVMDKKKDK